MDEIKPVYRVYLKSQRTNGWERMGPDYESIEEAIEVACSYENAIIIITEEKVINSFLV